MLFTWKQTLSDEDGTLVPKSSACGARHVWVDCFIFFDTDLRWHSSSSALHCIPTCVCLQNRTGWLSACIHTRHSDGWALALTQDTMMPYSKLLIPDEGVWRKTVETASSVEAGAPDWAQAQYDGTLVPKSSACGHLLRAPCGGHEHRLAERLHPHKTQWCRTPSYWFPMKS